MVVGDLGLDHYLVGDAGRISREYPVIILNHERDEYRLGGAANTVANLAALGAEVIPAGWIGTDDTGDELLKVLTRTGCSTEAVVRDAKARTVTKTRIVAGSTHGGGLGQHLLRVDQLGTGAQRRPDFPPGRVEPNGCYRRAAASSRYSELPAMPVDEVDEIPVLNHDSLRGAGRPGSIDNVGQIFWTHSNLQRIQILRRMTLNVSRVLVEGNNHVTLDFQARPVSGDGY